MRIARYFHCRLTGYRSGAPYLSCIFTFISELAQKIDLLIHNELENHAWMRTDQGGHPSHCRAIHDGEYHAGGNLVH